MWAGGGGQQLNRGGKEDGVMGDEGGSSLITFANQYSYRSLLKSGRNAQDLWKIPHCLLEMLNRHDLWRFTLQAN